VTFNAKYFPKFCFHISFSITITIVEIIHRHVFYLKHNVTEMEPNYSGTRGNTNHYLRTPPTSLSTEVVPVSGTLSCVGAGFQRRGNSSVDLAQLSRYHLQTETESSLRKVFFKIKQHWVMSRTVIDILIYHRHKPTDTVTCWARSGDVMCFL
jgi:hypothetical protein